jgi:membrane protease YdiL (CAAX protease family)
MSFEPNNQNTQQQYEPYIPNLSTQYPPQYQQYPQYPPLYYVPTPKSEIRKDIMATFLVVLLFFVANSTLQSIFIMIQVFAGGGFTEMLDNIMSNPDTVMLDMDGLTKQITDLFTNVPGGLGVSMIVAEILALSTLFILRGKKAFTSDLTQVNHKIEAPKLGMLFVIAFGAQFIFGVISALVDAALAGSGGSGTDMMQQSVEMLQTPSGLVYIMLAGPIMEEIIFRGAVLNRLKVHGVNFAIVISSMLFGMVHVYPMQAIFAFAVGIILGYTATHYSIKWSMVLHILVNSFATFIDMYIKSMDVQWIIFIVFFVIAILILVLYRRTIKDQLVVGKPGVVGTWRYALSSPFFIMGCALFLIAGWATMFLGKFSF